MSGTTQEEEPFVFLYFDDDIFDRLPEGPVDEAHHEHFYAMMDDVHTVMTRNAALRRRVLGHVGDGMIGIGCHTAALCAGDRSDSGIGSRGVSRR